ncbi:hypothetical protein [Paenibacillus donghaensis]|uniref:Uncharacterized protein n=1 Tax=Paenibacillus donghaensis TaxID=414771 RepID=A0A2Z2KTV1_9BACL|nr:hypothetical protein [Paenibacillus donghaensis]ASA24321.1 hypothetical protein B9T62_28290 [Paenibacillus donghaensis]
MKANRTNEPVFGKTQLVNSALFAAAEKDVLQVILQADQQYTLEESKQKLESYLKTPLAL